MVKSFRHGLRERPPERIDREDFPDNRKMDVGAGGSVGSCPQSSTPTVRCTAIGS